MLNAENVNQFVDQRSTKFTYYDQRLAYRGCFYVREVWMFYFDVCIVIYNVRHVQWWGVLSTLRNQSCR